MKLMSIRPTAVSILFLKSEYATLIEALTDAYEYHYWEGSSSTCDRFKELLNRMPAILPEEEVSDA